ncbi:hypothetical protein BCT30_20595 [Enterovibrio norvegicus]|uniref:DUF3069 domain-containing protein n=2 Tax=Enterovibrio norvegicus TaxID=188144 RepID=A0A1I5QC11_9GAMM|nr:DUF3069 domain-containing protein [Enterovibrio norvegicus]MCC4798715.1 DUF3069 domain-containing protein [Enterovibrio norvegicus]OEE62034.1 hypothetical protein A1OS_18905 [Enterovibrio norvegicus]OEF54767.1 hypothetical protein A1OW_05990 [Enterovibrio norvegicus]OEF56909.1 hypothetical protein A1OU_19375 [Enterovibrio norvegicus]PMH67885.1 hypothetical protein BCU62_07310 [Enterovibrio norvegicus]
MSEQANEAVETVKLENLSAELQQVIKYEQVPAELYTMLASVHEAAEDVVREAWDALPASAQNILDNFEQFHALVSLSQSYAGIDFLQECQDLKFDDMTQEQADDYKATLLDKLLFNCVKDLAKQLKQARMKPAMKREFREIFQK